MKNIWITGCRGFIGSNITNKLKNIDNIELYYTSHDTVDLQNENDVLNYVQKNNIKGIIHCSGVGGKRLQSTTTNDAYVNIRMHEILNLCEDEVDFILMFGSGAEFDRRNNIYKVKEHEALSTVPVDPYGFSKNLINRRVASSNKWYNIRLFGCFHHTEEPQRFIKSNILKRIKNEPIVIDQNKIMDFFFMDDLIQIVLYYIKWCTMEKLPKSINMSYPDKVSLENVASLIQKIVPGSNNDIIIKNSNLGLGYCGDGTLLQNTFNFQYDGLFGGIQKTYEQLKLHN